VSEAEALIEALPAGDRTLWATAFYAGVRLGELRALRWGDLDLAAGRIEVRRSWDPEAGEIEPKSDAGRRRVASGVNLKAVSVFMGHANISITLDRYGHLLPGSVDEGAELLDA
jgi:integrase